MIDHLNTNQNGGSNAPVPAPDTALPPFDVAKYRPEIASFGLSEAQEHELLQTLWSIMHGFVEMGFRFDVCAAVFGAAENVAGNAGGAVDSLGAEFSENANDRQEGERP